MIALDTDLVLSALRAGDDARSTAARKLWLKARRDGTALFISDIVLVDIAWALESRHQLSRAAIADVLGRLFATELVVVSNAGVIARTISAYRTGRAAFADYLIREQAIAAGARGVATFDSAMKGEKGFEVG